MGVLREQLAGLWAYRWQIWVDVAKEMLSDSRETAGRLFWVVAMPLVSLVLASRSMPLLVVGGILGPVAIYAFFPPLQTVLTEIVPQRRLGLAYAVHILFLAGVGQGLGPYVVGRISDATGSLVPALGATVVLMGVASALARKTPAA